MLYVTGETVYLILQRGSRLVAVTCPSWHQVQLRPSAVTFIRVLPVPLRFYYASWALRAKTDYKAHYTDVFRQYSRLNARYKMLHNDIILTFLGTTSGGGPTETRNCSSLVLDLLEDGHLWSAYPYIAVIVTAAD